MKLPTGDSPPISNKNRPTPPYLQDVEEQQILRWLSQGVITISDGPWSSPLVIVPKGYGGYRVCIDYRKLNAVTVADATPVANMSEKLALVQGTSTKPLKFFCDRSRLLKEYIRPLYLLIVEFIHYIFDRFSSIISGTAKYQI